MSNVYRMLTALKEKSERRAQRNRIGEQVAKEKKYTAYFRMRYFIQVLGENGIHVQLSTAQQWCRKKLFGKGMKLFKNRYMVTKKGVNEFLETMNELDDEIYPVPERPKKPPEKRLRGIRSKRIEALKASGMIPDPEGKYRKG